MGEQRKSLFRNVGENSLCQWRRDISKKAVKSRQYQSCLAGHHTSQIRSWYQSEAFSVGILRSSGAVPRLPWRWECLLGLMSFLYCFDPFFPSSGKIQSRSSPLSQALHWLGETGLLGNLKRNLYDGQPNGLKGCHFLEARLKIVPFSSWIGKRSFFLCLLFSSVVCGGKFGK